MCAFLNPDVRQWIDIVAECLTAVGTVGAVIVALYLSRKDRREKISVSPAIHYSVGPEQTLAESIRLFGLTATNVGFATVTAQSLCCRVGVFRRKVLYVNTWGLPTETPPKTLRRGDWLTVR